MSWRPLIIANEPAVCCIAGFGLLPLRWVVAPPDQQLGPPSQQVIQLRHLGCGAAPADTDRRVLLPQKQMPRHLPPAEAEGAGRGSGVRHSVVADVVGR